MSHVPPTPNVELLEKTMQYLVDHPEEHYQAEVWFCGTPACFVGWAQHFSGLSHGQACQLSSHVDWAVEHLGLNYVQAVTIFSGENTMPMLQLMVKDVLNGEKTKTIDEYRIEAHGS